MFDIMTTITKGNMSFCHGISLLFICTDSTFAFHFLNIPGWRNIKTEPSKYIHKIRPVHTNYISKPNNQFLQCLHTCTNLLYTCTVCIVCLFENRQNASFLLSSDRGAESLALRHRRVLSRSCGRMPDNKLSQVLLIHTSWSLTHAMYIHQSIRRYNI